MVRSQVFTFRIDPALNGDEILISPETARKLSVISGAQLAINSGEPSIKPSPFQIKRIYVEPTNACNLNCLTCIRNVWQEPSGQMTDETFAKILSDLQDFDPPPALFFGGFGEPLSHPHIFNWIGRAKTAKIPVELITNATLLNSAAVSRLIDLQMDRLWVSLDGATPEKYEDIRLGAALPGVLENLRRFEEMRTRLFSRFPRLGIAFVAMRRNISDLSQILRLGQRFGADRFSISNVLAHTPELRQQSLYDHTQYQSPAPITIDFPRFDPDTDMLSVLGQAIKEGYRVSINNRSVSGQTNSCPFIARSSVSIRWDGKVSPCLPLLHTHSAYLDDHLRLSKEFLSGDIHTENLKTIWEAPESLELRRRLLDFDFSPCTYCNSCEFSEANLEDCFGSTQPACGGCLWAQGIIQCP